MSQLLQTCPHRLTVNTVAGLYRQPDALEPPDYSVLCGSCGRRFWPDPTEFPPPKDKRAVVNKEIGVNNAEGG